MHKQKFYIFFLFGLLFFSAPQISAQTNWYVSNTQQGANNGTSWANAWSTSTIVPENIQPGDVVYLDGGSSSMTYSSTFNIGFNGSPSGIVTIKPGVDAGHNGTVIFNTGGSTRAINIQNNKYLRLLGLTFNNSGGIFVDGNSAGATNVIYIDSCSFTNAQTQGSILLNGYNAGGAYTYVDSVFIRWNYIQNGQSSSQVDCIYMQYAENVFIIANTILNDNLTSTSHVDCIQAGHVVNNLMIANNYLYNAGYTIAKPNQTLMLEELSGNIILYNNVLYAPDQTGYMNQLVDKNANNAHSLTIVNNTIISSEAGQFYSDGTSDLFIKNNIFYHSAQVPSVREGFHLGINTYANLDANLYTPLGAIGTGIIAIGGYGGTSMSSLNSSGAETSGTPSSRDRVDPLFVNNSSNWHLQSGSPARNQGVNLQNLVEGWGVQYVEWKDKDGVTRDNTPDIGAYEFVGSGGGNNPPNQASNPTPVNGAINQPASLTLTWSCSDPNGDPLTYSVYFGTTNNPPLVASNQSNASYNPGQLNNSTIYYWKIVAKDNLGATTSGPVWNFSTINATGGGGNDVIPPKLIRVQCIQSDKVVLDFSEPLDENLATNLGNYVISNQLHVLSVKIDSSLDRIILTTDPANVNQLYTVTVSNLTDTAGNLISSQANSLFYKLLEVGSTGYTNYLINNVEASSTSDTNTSASKTLDGLVNGDPDPNSRWASQAMPQWIQFDLGAPEPVNLIAVSFFQWNNGRIYNYSIETSDDSVKWQQVVTNASSASQEWTINDFTNLTTRYIRIICLSNNQADWAGIWEARILKSDKATSIEESSIPQSFALEQNYPNPFNPTTNIRFSIPKESFVTLKVYNILGKEIATLVNERKPQGTYNLKFDASNLPSGIYFARIQADSFIDVKKMSLIK